jgi:hypothetical protein
MKTRIGAAFWLVWIVLTVAAGAAEQTPVPRIEIPSLEHTFEPVAEGETVVHDFVVRNAGEAELEIYKVRTG